MVPNLTLANWRFLLFPSPLTSQFKPWLSLSLSLSFQTTHTQRYTPLKRSSGTCRHHSPDVADNHPESSLMCDQVRLTNDANIKAWQKKTWTLTGLVHEKYRLKCPSLDTNCSSRRGKIISLCVTISKFTTKIQFFSTYKPLLLVSLFR